MSAANRRAAIDELARCAGSRSDTSRSAADENAWRGRRGLSVLRQRLVIRGEHAQDVAFLVAGVDVRQRRQLIVRGGCRHRESGRARCRAVRRPSRGRRRRGSLAVRSSGVPITPRCDSRAWRCRRRACRATTRRACRRVVEGRQVEARRQGERRRASVPRQAIR